MLRSLTRGVTRGIIHADGSGGAVGGMPEIVGARTSVAEAVIGINMLAPAGIEEGELLVLMIASGLYNKQYTYFDTPIGWTLQVGVGEASAGAQVLCYTKVADGTEGTVYVGWSGLEQSYTVGRYYRLSGVDPDDIVDASSTIGWDSKSTYFPIPQHTTTGDNRLTMGVWSYAGGDITDVSTPSPGWETEIINQAGPGTISGTTGGFFYKEMPTAGVTGELGVLGTGPADGSAGIQISFVGI